MTWKAGRLQRVHLGLTMTTDLPAAVRDRAAQAVFKAHQPAAYGSDVTWDDLDEPQRNRWLHDVDTVAEVLATEDVGVALLDANEGLADAQVRIARALGITERPYSVGHILARVEELTAILESKDASLRTLVAQLDQATVRIAELEVPLRGMVRLLPDTPELKARAWDHIRQTARAALTAAPTLENQPHTCQPPDVGTIREGSSYSERRWNCPSCGTQWIAMARPVDRPPVWKWCRMRYRQLPDVERAEP